MGIIRVLDEHIANQIAAGEVVERPSSVVKELVENAVDAGSSRIDVTIEEGGLALIRVSDNGSGMQSDDCEAAFFRHATSKIVSSQDLFSIRTLGFRGEALPSIAAVSKVTCLTSTNSSGLGHQLVIEGGTVKVSEETAAPRGTDIQVRELFYNTPARLKYMKTVQTELGHVSDFIYRLALAHPEIAFTLKHNGSVMIQTLGNEDMRGVIAAIYGTTVAKTMLPIEGEQLDYSIRGFIGKPETTRANRNGISTFINGRYVRNFTLIHALLQGYHTFLPINRFPVAAIHIEMDPTLVDVNVHPAKLEVRFSKEQELIQFVEEQVRHVLNQQVLIPTGTAPSKSKPINHIQEQLELYRSAPPASLSNNGNIDKAYDRKQDVEALNRWSQADLRSERELDVKRTVNTFSSNARDTEQKDKQLRNEPVQSFKEQAAANEVLLRTMAADEHTAAPVLPSFPKLSPIGQMHGTYIIAQNEEGLFLIDQHAAHERINYEYYFEKFGNPAEASQELLVPITLEFTSSDAVRIQDKLPLLEQAGVYVEPFGGNSFLVRAYPHWFPDGDEKALIDEMTEWLLAERKSVDVSRLREKAAIMCSCKASIKANQSMRVNEMETLLDRLASCRNPYTCPHGRPIVISFSTYELEKLFKRVM
ncbi:DNA mismatch repair endonuclease MutL [Paenibacillus sp. FSL H7-0331]|uniref:DNA mismatch repair endonuclease MutL n=1 Tax=Paenibacillus sp. FSL H7-0331 TaxID=1920421 RepID=UPI00096F8F81|nr:DNA mismatch repair endonuclease MutL [Paenibacillus sp. FSL H7-0331]OMF19872.1 DNA mismatch repair protein MutL [Paenibacillus sp. FSL H7-0331]